MKVTKEQLVETIKEALREANYYTKQATHGEADAAKKFENKFNEHSSMPWKGTFDKDKKSQTLKSKLTLELRFEIVEPKASEYVLSFYVGNKSKAFFQKNLNKSELNTFLASDGQGIDDVVIEAIAKHVKEGSKE